MLPATLLGSAALLLVDVYASHALSVADYGLYGGVRRAAQILGFVVLLGMENAVIRVVARAPAAPDARAGVRGALLATAGAGVVLGALVAAGAPWLAGFVDDSPHTTVALRIAALALPLWAVRTITVAAAQGWGNLWPRALVTFLLWPVVQFAGLLALVNGLGLGVLGAVAGYTAAVALGAAQGVWHLWRSPRPPAGSGPPGEGSLPRMWAVAWPQWVHGVSMALYTWLDQVLLVGLAGATVAGRYGPVAQLTPLFAMGLGALNSAFAGVIARKHADGDHVGLGAQYRLVTRWAMVLAVPPVVVAVVAPMSVLSPWASASGDTADALRVVAVTQLVCTAVGSVNYLLLMSGRPRDPLWNALPAVAVSAVGSWVLIPAYGAVGASLANGGAMVVANVGGLVQVGRHLRIHPFHAGLVRPLVAGSAVAAVSFVAERTLGSGLGALVAIVLVGGLAYAGCLLLLGLDEGDREVLAALRRKVGR
jgi:O-antigen/teichoic acid export membrane protein